MNKNAEKTLKLLALVAALLLVAGCKKAPVQETEVPETTVSVQTTAGTVMETIAETIQETEVVETIPKVTAPEAGSIGYVEYLELTVEEQQAYYENFASADEFFAWMEKAKEEYEAAIKATEATSSENVGQDNEGYVEIEGGIIAEEEGEDLE